MIIEKVVIEDMEAILNIQKEAYISQAAIYDDYTIHPLVETLEEALKDFEIKEIFKATVDGQIVGAIRVLLKEGTCHIGQLCIHPNFQGRGMGTQLLHKIEETFKNYNRLELFAGSKSLDNIRLYERLGYKKFKTAKYSDKADIVYMEKYK